MARRMSDSELIQSIPPAMLADELTQRYSAGTSALVQLIDHFSQRGRLEETIALTIEKTPVTTTNRGSGLKGFASIKFQTSTKDESSVEANVLLPQLQKEAENVIRMHLHLSGRLANEVVVPLEGFVSGEAWGAAGRIQARLQEMAVAMHAHHDQIPKISARTVSKSARASQQAMQKLEDEKNALMGLQNEWQRSVSNLVAQFEAADVARVKAIREALLRFEHYRNEFYKAAQADISSVSELTQQYQPSVRIVDALGGGGGRSHVQPTSASAAENHNGNRGVEQVPGSATPNAVGVGSQAPPHIGDNDTAQIEAPSKSFLKLNIFRSKTKRVKKKSSGNGTVSDSSASTGSYSHSHSHSHNISSSGIASPSIANTNMSTTTNPGIPVSIHTANTNSSNALSSGLPSEQRIHADTQQHSSSQQAAAVADVLHPQSPPLQQQVLQTSSPLKKTPLAHPNTGDFAEWVFTDNTQETSSSRNNSNYSVGSMVHVSGSLAAIEEASDSSQQRSRSSIGISKQTVIKEPPSQAKATSSAAEFDDAFGSLQISASPKPLSAKADDIGDSKQIDLDAAFNIPQAPLTSKAKDMSFEDVFGPGDVFKPSEHNDEAKKSLQMARLGDTGSPLITRSSGHRRGTSVGVPESPSTRAKSVEFAAGEKSGSGDSSNGSDADEDADTSFRVNFSIREKAIKDNPDESKAALSRVTTLLRSAPSTRRGRNRRDVRTMYVPSSAPITNAIETQGSQDAIGGKDGSGSTAQDSGTPITPMPVRPETTTEAEADTKQSEAQDADAQLEKARDIPVATETLPDTAAVAEADIAAVSTAETITSAPLAEESPSPAAISEEPKPDDILPPSTAPAAGPEAAEINETADALPSSNEIPPSSQPPTQTQKGEGPGRRRAPPPPPPPAAPVVQQQIAASSASNASAETKIDTSLMEADTLEHQIQNQSQLTSSKSMHRGRRAGVSTGPPPISMNVREIIDYEVAIVHKPGVGDALQCIYQATGEVSMHIQDAINPLELAPLRVAIKRAEDGMDLVANPSVAVLDTSFTATVADGRDWYRFVRPNLFAQVKGPEGTDVVVFKYMMKGVSGSLHNVPIVVRQAESHTDGVYGMLAFYEPNVNSKFAGSTVSELALMLSMSGNLTLEASRPTASWYQEHNRLLWKLDDLSVPSADQAESMDSSILSYTLAMKARGDGALMVDSIALRFVVHGSKIVDTALCIARVAAAASTSHQPNQQAAVGSSGSSMPATVVIDGPASFTIRSGKCIYKGLSGSHRPEPPHEQEDEDGEDDSKSEAASSSEEEEAWASDEGGNNDSNSDDDDGDDSNAKGK